MIDIGTRLTSQRTAMYEVGEYELKERLGGGRIAQVFLAEQTWPPEKGRHLVAIKLAASQSQNDRLESERQVLEKMGGEPGFTRMEGYGMTREDGRAFLVMELIPRDSELARIARGSPEHRLDERLGIAAALQYARMLQALHAAGYASTDRKLDDVIWDDKTDPGRPRLVVLDWNVTAVDREIGPQRDLYQFGLFWYELLLGTPPPPEHDRAIVRLDDHPQWGDLTFGAQRMLTRALHRVAARRYQQAEELVKDLEALASLFDLGAEGLIARAKPADSADALMALDVIRVCHPDIWPGFQDLALRAREAMRDRHETLLDHALSELRQAQYGSARSRLEIVQRDVSQDPEKALRIERWLRLARFGDSLKEAKVEAIFRTYGLPILAGADRAPGVIEHIENVRFRHVADQFWDMLRGAFLDSSRRGKVPTDFLTKVEEARRQHGQGYDPKPWFQEAYLLLREPWSSQATLFGAVVGLGNSNAENERQGGLFFLADEALMQEKLREAHVEARTGDLHQAAVLYGQAQRLFEAIPYADLLYQAGLEKPSESQQLVERLANTLQEAEKCLESGKGLLEARPPEFKRALAEFGRGLGLLQVDGTWPKWAQVRSEGTAAALRAQRARAQRGLDLQEVLETDDLETPLMRCQALLDEFPEDTWGQEQRGRLRDKLIARVEEALGYHLVSARAAPEPGDALSAAQLVALARRYFPDDMQVAQRLPEWELRATFALEKQFNSHVARAEDKLRQDWQGGLKGVLDEWMAGHALLRQASFFPGVFDLKARQAQERKLDALHEQVRYLAQLQRDMAAELGTQRAGVDEEEQRRREIRRQAHSLWQEAQELSKSGQRDDWEAAPDLARQALELWPERPGVREFIERVEQKIEDIDRRFDEAIRHSQAALDAGNYERALAVLDGAPADVELRPAQREARQALRASIGRARISHQVDEAQRRAQMALAAGEYEGALVVLAEKAPPEAELLPEQQQALQSLRVSIEGLAAAKERMAAIRQESPQLRSLLAGDAQGLPQVLERLGQVADLIEGTPGELPEELRAMFLEYVEQAESLLWETHSRLRTRKRSLRAQMAGALALVGLTKKRLAARPVLEQESKEETA